MQCEINLIIYTLNTHKIKWMQTETLFGLSLNSTGSAYFKVNVANVIASLTTSTTYLSLSLSLFLSLSLPLCSSFFLFCECHQHSCWNSIKWAFFTEQHPTNNNNTLHYAHSHTHIHTSTDQSVGSLILNIPSKYEKGFQSYDNLIAWK